MTDTYQNKLYIHEWMAVVFFLAIMTVLTIATHSCNFNSFDSSHALQDTAPVHHIISPTIEVFVEGEVEFPGKHLVKRSTKVKELLALAKPKQNANLKSLKMDAVLRKGQRLRIPTMKMIKITLIHSDGRIEEKEFVKGTSFEGLVSTCVFEGEILIKKNQKKRRLKDGEVVKIRELEKK